MRHWKVILAASLIFGLGVATGVLAQRAVNANTSHGRGRDAGMGTLLDSRFAPIQKMREELQLSAEQAQRINAILHDGQGRMRQFWDTCQPRLKAEMKEVREGICAELTPEQCVKFDELLKRHRELRIPKADKDDEKRRNLDSQGKSAPGEPSASPRPEAARKPTNP